MAMSIPGPRDDDPEEVSDKLSIAAAMWARGEAADAISWLRRAAASAADVEADDRALELAKAAADLLTSTTAAKTQGSTAQAGTKPASPPKPSPSRGPTSAPPIGSRPPATVARPAPKPSGQPSSGNTRLAPLPPLRPLGAASQHMRASQRPTQDTNSPLDAGSSRSPSVAGSPSAPGLATASLVDESSDHEQTSVMPVAQAEALARSEPPPAELADAEARAVWHRDAEATGPAAEPPPSVSMHAATDAEPRPQLEPELAIGLRVRLYATEGGAWVVPDAPGAQGGVAVVVVPVHPDDDLRSLFARKLL